MGFPAGSAVKNPLAMQELQEMWVPSLGLKDPLEEGMAIHSSILAWNPMDRGLVNPCYDFLVKNTKFRNS